MHIFFQGNQTLKLSFRALLTSFSTHLVHIRPGGRWQDLRSTAAGMLKNAAQEFFPLNSSALMFHKVLAHNLFHKICEEPGRHGRTVSCRVLVCQGRDYTSRRPAQGRQRQTAGSAGGPDSGGRDRAQNLCVHPFRFSNQALGIFPAALLTSFSTVCVQSGCLARLKCEQVPMLKIWAQAFFPYESRVLPFLDSLAHNFVHKKCEEANIRAPGRCRRARRMRCRIFKRKNFLEQNQTLTRTKAYFAQIYPQKLWASHGSKSCKSCNSGNPLH